MIYRKLDENGDYSFGSGRANFFKDVPDAVAQAIQTRLNLLQGEWYLDTSDGTPYMTQVLGERTKPLLDGTIQRRILKTKGISNIAEYSSSIDVDTRKVTIRATVNTIYGTTNLVETI